MEMKQKINIENWDNSNIHKSNAKNYEELYAEVQRELMDKLAMQNQILINFLENNDLESAKHWADNISKTTTNIIAKNSEFEENQYQNELNYLIVNFKNNEIDIQSYYFDDWMQFNKVYESSSKLNDYYSSILEDNYKTLESSIFTNLIDEINNFEKISNSELLDYEINTYEIIDSCKNDGFIKLNSQSILLLNPNNDYATGLDAISFKNYEIKEIEKDKEYLNELKTKLLKNENEREI